MKRNMVYGSGVAIAVVLAACGAAEDPEAGATESDHTAGEYIHENHPMFWTASSFDEFRRVSEAGRWSSNPQPVGPQDIAEEWLQLWGDRVDAIVRKKVKADTGQELVAPKPVFHLLPSSSISNAWVTSIPACVPWTIRARGAEPSEPFSGEGPAPVLLFNHYNKRVSKLTEITADETKLAGCVERTDFAEHQAMFVEHWNQNAPACRAEISADGAIEVDASCVSGVTEAAEAAVYSTSPHIQFSSDLLAAGTEAGAVFVIAHELAHFYRAHGSPLARYKYGFWYDQDPSSPKRPVEAKDGTELRRLYEEVLALPKANRLQIEGASYSPRYREIALDAACRYIGDLARDASEESPLDASCATVAEQCRALSSLQYAHNVNEQQAETYLKFEAELPVCAQTLSLGDTSEAKASALISRLQSKRYLPAGSAETVPVPRSFAALLAQVEQKAVEFDQQVEKFAERLRLGRIGLYTTEQEADELALEWVNLLGFSTEQAIDGWLTYLDFFNRGYSRSGEPTPAECRALFNADFKQGRAFTTVFLGDLESAHHSGCYRVYNLWREQRAHKYEPAKLTRPRSASSFANVVKQAETLSRGAY